MTKLLSRRFAPLLVGLLLLAGCDDNPAASGPEPGAPAPAMQTLASSSNGLVQGQYGSYTFETRENLVLRSPDDFAAFWQTLHANRGEAPGVPSVDFSQHVVVAALAGVKPSGGFTIEIESVARQADGSHAVRITEVKPGSRCGATAALTSPYHVVQVATTSEPFRFETEQLTRTCD